MKRSKEERKKYEKNMNGKELLIMIEKKRVVQSDTIKDQRGNSFKCRRCQEPGEIYLLDYQTAWKD